ncbi:ATP-dependent helicase [Kocuria massiliensis]|uniref:ATP-dependent helicase n=1 Tax=Kocuria massiliensis TaxID=1926282 RepID=UPI0022B978BC|nr:ATP-dependent helicase [Kocuria massiliensis]
MTTGTPRDPDQILEGLDPEQREVATSLQGPVCVLAGAGTGKTRAITHRIAYGIASGAYVGQRVLALTFTARAANEMRNRLRSLGAVGVQTRTFHAAALRQLQYFWPQAVGGTPPQLLSGKAQYISEAATRLRFTTDRAVLRDLASHIEWAKVSMLTPDTVEEHFADRELPTGFTPTGMARIMRGYEDLKTERNAIDFEDVLLATVAILEEDEAVAASVRQQYRHFVVDEYQDVSPLQQRLLDCWLGGRDELCVVGDASQTIYSFTGATSRHLLDFPRRHPDGKVITLVRDYRSTPQVVHLANSLLTSRRPDRGATPGAWAAPLELRAQRPTGPEPEWFEYGDDEQEATGIAEDIADLISHDGVAPADIAVLFRTNGQSQAIEQALTDAGIGYQLRGTEKFFNRPEVKQAILQIRSAARAAGDEPAPQVVRDCLASLGYKDQPPASTGSVRSKWESLSALVSLADRLQAAHTASNGAGAATFTLEMLVEDLTRRIAHQDAPVMNGVTLASLHSAKGLEWDAVFLCGLSEGLMPISFAQTGDEIDEERRLLYVGITRARERIYFSWSLSRTPGGKAHRKRSRFLDDIIPRQRA